MTLPAPALRNGRLLLGIPGRKCQTILHAWADRHGVRWEAVGARFLAIELQGDVLDLLVDDLPLLMSDVELQETRVLLLPPSSVFRPADLLLTDSAAQFVEKVRGEWLAEMLREDGLDTAFQPIFDLRTGQPVAHECLMRGNVGGKLFYPDEMIRAARETGLLFHLDRAARIRALENAADRGVSTDVYVNFNPTSIYNPASCLQTTVRAAERAGIPRERIVFEVVESDRVEDESHLCRILNHYRKEGFRVALDDLGSGYSSLNLMTEILPDVAKLDMALIRGIDTDPVRQKVVAHLISLARSLGVQTVVEGIETPGELEFCRMAGAELAQGYLFAAPAPYPVRSTPQFLF